jgi:hypothetical protein
MKSRILLATLFIALSAFAGERWSSPDKFYSIIPPQSWKRTHQTGAAGFSDTFTSPDGRAEICISAGYHLKRLPATLPDEVLDTAFPNEHGLAAMKHIRGSGWSGLRREYADKSGGATRWIGISARRGSTLVLLTMKARSKDFERLRPTFESVSRSLTLGE